MLNTTLTPIQKLLKLELESSLKENSKGQIPSTENQTVEEKLTISSNPFVTEVGG